MNTYSESKEEHRFNWRGAIQYQMKLLEMGPEYDEIGACEKRKQMAEFARNWVTCACGNLCDRIPRASNGDPLDRRLSAYGMRFYDLVSGQEWEEALQVLERIEDRSAEILAQMDQVKTHFSFRELASPHRSP